MLGSGSTRTLACATCDPADLPPLRHGYELFDMFCALDGATRTPRLRSQAQMA